MTMIVEFGTPPLAFLNDLGIRYRVEEVGDSFLVTIEQSEIDRLDETSLLALAKAQDQGSPLGSTLILIDGRKPIVAKGVRVSGRAAAKVAAQPRPAQRSGDALDAYIRACR